MKTRVYLYVFDTMADWEIGYLTSEINSGRYYRKGLKPVKIVTVANEKTPVTTMGGLKILPDKSVKECDIKSSDVLILPGGDTWTEPIHNDILKITENCLKAGTLVAAICGATIALAQKGILNMRWHTSNDLGFLKSVCPNYTGEDYFRFTSAVTDDNLVTATGIDPLTFSKHVLQAMDVFSEETLEAWYSLYEKREPQYFYSLMNSIQ